MSIEWYEIVQEMIDEMQYQEALEDARVEGWALGLAEGRAEAEHTIFLLKKENDGKEEALILQKRENEELRKQLALQG